MNPETRIGIYAGTFDPLHVGHLSFALAAKEAARLECVYFLPERIPRHKPLASPYETRVAALKHSLDGGRLKLLELPDDAFTIHETLPELEAIFPGSQIVLLVGADVLRHMPAWPGIDTLDDTFELAVGVRTGYDILTITKSLQALGFNDSCSHIVETDQAHVSSTTIRTNSR